MVGLGLYLRSAGEVVRVLCATGGWRGISHQPVPKTTVKPDFFGVNVAGSAVDGVNAYVMNRLGDLGVRHVRMDFSYTDPASFQADLLRELVAQNYRVMVRLVQPVEQARRMPSASALAHWQEFLIAFANMFDLDGLEAIEVGAVPNRKKWSGYTHAGYLAAWSMAKEVLQSGTLAGPNVSDFEPLHTIVLLQEMNRRKIRPDIHTTNLFVERVREPEAFDHRVLGKRCADYLKLNLVKKAGVFADLGVRYGVSRTVCTHTCWNAIRLKRWSEDIERVRAAYLERYLVLAAASGHLERVYWGPLIGHGDGLIDDGSGAIDPTERVGHYAFSPGCPDGYKVLPAFERYREVIENLSNATFVTGDADPTGPFEFVFEREGQTITACWERDGLDAGEGIIWRKR